MRSFAARGLWSWALALALAGLALAQPGAGNSDLLARLRSGGYIFYFRHADTDQRQQDQRPINLGDCATQRNLTERGRVHSREIGEVVRALAIPITAVLASPLCRTVETAELAFGAATRSEAVRAGAAEGFPGLRALLSTPVVPGGNVVVVGHAYPYYKLAGGQFLSEGEADVVRPRGGDFEVVARLSLRQWRELASAPSTR